MILPGLGAIWIAWMMAAGSCGPATVGIAGSAMNGGRTASLAFAPGTRRRVRRGFDFAFAEFFGVARDKIMTVRVL